MGGSNQATCPPVPSSAVSSRTKTPTKTANPVRFHEVPTKGEVHFHDDLADVKCSVESAAFFSAYNKWRPTMAEDLTLAGNDGSGGHTAVTFLPYIGKTGELEVGMTVSELKVSQTLTDLDKLAHFS